jgi:hypothetical protein
MEDLKPEAVYLYPEDGQRGGLMVVNVDDSADIPNVLEPFWFALNADVQVTPVMSGDDLLKGLDNIGKIASRYS